MKVILNFLFLFLTFHNIFGQNFSPEPLIELPGKNINFEILVHEYDNMTYICWENKFNSIYSIFIKQIKPQILNNILIVQDTMANINPTLTYTSGTDIKIVWQKWINNHWQLQSRSLIQDSLTEITSITDSLSNNTDPAIYFEKLVWIHDSSLVISSEDSGWGNFIVLDSTGCSHPDLISSYYNTFYGVVYEKIENGQIIIKEIIEFAGNLSSHVHADSGININPNYGYDLSLSYQKFENNIWKIVIPGYQGDEWISSNQLFNVANPSFFSFMILFENGSENISNVFIAYDSDSLANNKDIYIKLFPDWIYPNSNIINISNLPGDDIKPYATLIDDSVTIVWEHKENNSIQIWWAKDYFYRQDPTAINSTLPVNLSLIRNYPNPFNPNTTIEYHINKSVLVNLKIFNSI